MEQKEKTASILIEREEDTAEDHTDAASGTIDKAQSVGPRSASGKSLPKPRIYVASLADYNAGRIHGRWIDATQDELSIAAEVSAMLADSPEPVAEEWAIHDYEGFGPLALSEWESVKAVSEVARLTDEHGLMFATLLNHLGGIGDLDEAKRLLEEEYHGQWESMPAFAENFISECYDLRDVPEIILAHVDYVAIARDLELSGDFFAVEHDGYVHVFSGNG